jgi:cytochrome b561
MKADPAIVASSTWLNSHERYGRVARSFHWGMAVLIFAAVAFGLYSGSLERSDPLREPVLTIHKSLGLTALFLVVLRMAWGRYSPAPRLSSRLKRWERGAAWVTHRLLYFLMLAMPVTGFLISQSAGREVSFFGLFTVPQIVPIDASVPPAERPIVLINAILHKTVLETLLYLVLGAHVAGALKHHFIDRDEEMLGRMWGGGPPKDSA